MQGVTYQSHKTQVIKGLNGLIKVITQPSNVLSQDRWIFIADSSWDTMGNHGWQRMVQDIRVQKQDFIQDGAPQS